MNPTSLDPHRAIEGYSFMVTNQLYDTLVRLGEGGVIEPALAESWSRPTATTLRLELRPGVRFHDGTALDAATVAASLERLVDPATGSRAANLFTAMARIEVIDELTLDLISEEPNTPLLGNFTFPGTAIVPLGADDALSRSPVGTGPFRFSSWRDGDSIELVPNDDYWGVAPRLEGVRFLVLPESAAQLIALRAGDVHIVHDIAPDAFRALEAVPGVELVTYPSDRTTYLEFNGAQPSLEDVRVRRAIAHAIDRELLAESLYRDLVLPPRGLLAPLVRYALAEPDDYHHDPGRALQLLDEAGVAGLELTLDIVTDSDSDALAQYVQAALAEVGIAVSIRRSDFPTYFDLIVAGQTELLVGFWGSDTLDPDFLLGLGLHSDHSEMPGFVVPEFDALVEEGARLPDGPERADVYRRAQLLVLAELPMLPLFHHVGTYAKRNGLEGERVVASSFQFDLRSAYFSGATP